MDSLRPGCRRIKADVGAQDRPLDEQPLDARLVVLIADQHQLRGGTSIDEALIPCCLERHGRSDVLGEFGRGLSKASSDQPLADHPGGCIAHPIRVERRRKELVHPPLIVAGMRVQPDCEQPPARAQDAAALADEGLLIGEMMEGVHAEHAIETRVDPAQPVGGPLRQPSVRSGCVRLLEHFSGAIQAGQRTAAAGGKVGEPVAGSTADFGNGGIGRSYEAVQKRSNAVVRMTLVPAIVLWRYDIVIKGWHVM